MRLSKKVQKLMPQGRELILQGVSSVEGVSMTVCITKTFGSMVDLDAWLEMHRDVIAKRLQTLEALCK